MPARQALADDGSDGGDDDDDGDEDGEDDEDSSSDGGDGGDDDDGDADGEDDDEDGDEDGDNFIDEWPPPVPDGWELVEGYYTPGVGDHIMYFSMIGPGPCQWHRMVIVRKVARSREGYTHDAYAFGLASKQRRGVKLTQSVYDDKCWRGIREVGVTPPPPPLPPPLPPPAAGKRRAKPDVQGWRSGRVKKRCAPFRPGDNTDGLAAYARP